MAKHLLSIYDLSKNEIEEILGKAIELKDKRKYLNVFQGKTLGILLEKPSTRTMVSFAVAMAHLGGTHIFLDVQKMQRSRGESIHDTTMTLSRYLDCLMVRAFNHSDLEEFAKYSTIPVVNGLTDHEHPCQILADIMTIMEFHKQGAVESLKNIKIVYTGDSNNVSNSLLAACAILGLNLTIISPKECLVGKEVLNKALKHVPVTRADINVTHNIDAAKDADVIYTDVWTSMGFESEQEKRKKIFAPYQVNSELLKKASSKCIVLHCLPAFRGEEITTDIMDKHQDSIFAQAENRLHAQKAVLLHLLK